MSDSIFRNCSAVSGGAIAAFSSLYLNVTGVVVEDCSAILSSLDRSTTDGGRGGAILAVLIRFFHVHNCTFSRNVAASGGGALYVESLDGIGGTSVISSSRFLRNSVLEVQGAGGAIESTLELKILVCLSVCLLMGTGFLFHRKYSFL